MPAHRSALLLRAATTLAAGASLVLAPPLGAPSGAATRSQVSLTFDGGGMLANSGTAALRLREVTNNGGAIHLTAGRDGNAARFPRFQSEAAPQAAITVVDAQGTDSLDPGTATFRYGAEFTLDDVSWGSSTDNGNNLVQRGLGGARTQYKLQVDYAHPDCRVKGRGGIVTAHSTRAVTPGVWYRAVCTRDGSTVTLTVTRLSDGRRWSYQDSGATGSMTPATRATPLSVGGKVKPSGGLVTSNADQFNGMVDNVFLHIG
jgi:hypothetical protein